MYIKLFFIFALVESVITLKIGDPNVCPKPVTERYVVHSRDRLKDSTKTK